VKRDHSDKKWAHFKSFISFSFMSLVWSCKQAVLVKVCMELFYICSRKYRWNFLE